MDPAIQSWMTLNRDARRVCEEATKRITKLDQEDVFIHICAAFMSKATQTLSAVNVLYTHHLEEPAQALIRILFEQRINFDCFLHLARSNPVDAVKRVVHSMELEKIKQARASGFAGIPDEMRKSLEANEAEIAALYSDEDLTRIKKHGIHWNAH